MRRDVCARLSVLGDGTLRPHVPFLTLSYVATSAYLDPETSDSPAGAVLVFLSGWDEIARTQERCADDDVLGDTRKYVITPLHAGLPAERQRDVFKRPPPGARKIVLATNVAETRGRARAKGSSPSRILRF